jgi:hypothetical protein
MSQGGVLLSVELGLDQGAPGHQASKTEVNEMTMPAFTASHSLCRRSTTYSLQSAVPERGTSAIEPQLRAGGGGSTNDCVDTYQNCYIDCSVKYPESNDSPYNLNSLMRDACFESCDAAYRLCGPARIGGRIGRRSGRIGHVAAPIFG